MTCNVAARLNPMKMESTQLVGNGKKMIRLNNYIAWEGKFSCIIETIASSADRSAMVTGPATSCKRAEHKHSNKENKKRYKSERD